MMCVMYDAPGTTAVYKSETPNQKKKKKMRENFNLMIPYHAYKSVEYIYLEIYEFVCVCVWFVVATSSSSW